MGYSMEIYVNFKAIYANFFGVSMLTPHPWDPKTHMVHTVVKESS